MPLSCAFVHMPSGDPRISRVSRHGGIQVFEDLIFSLPHVNAFLNLTATVLLFLGWGLIKSRNESAHRAVMLTCFAVSVLFLICYLTYHIGKYQITGDASKAFPRDAYPIAWHFYWPLLLVHVLLAAVVPFLAIIAIYFGLRDKRESHKKIARWAMPIWLIVSITGVMVYVMLYWLFPARVVTAFNL